MEVRIGPTRIRVHPLMLMLPLLASMLGMRMEPAILALSLMLHEAAHLLAARLARVRVEQLRLMPFGGTAQLGNLYTLSPGQVLAVAAAGPLANLGLLLASAALAQWGVLPPLHALLLARVNLMLMLFNLLPALPLDGGRMLYALTAGRLGRKRAAGLGILLGRVLAAALIAGMLYSRMVTGMFNLSMLFSAIFILASAPGERQALGEARASSLLNAVKPMGEPVAMRLCAVDGQCGARRAIRCTVPDAATLFAVYEGESLRGFTDDRQLLRVVLDDPESAVTTAELIHA